MFLGIGGLRVQGGRLRCSGERVPRFDRFDAIDAMDAIVLSDTLPSLPHFKLIDCNCELHWGLESCTREQMTDVVLFLP